MKPLLTLPLSKAVESPLPFSETVVCELVHQVFEIQANLTPNSIAVAFNNQCVSYQALNQRANQLSAYLIQRGLKQRSLCGIAIERSIDQMVAILAILKAGAAYVPLDPSYPKDRLACMIEDSQLPLLLCQRTLAAKLSNCSTTTIFLDEVQDRISTLSCANPNVKNHGAAYVVFTSGSTGRPKGLVMGHAPLLNLLQWQRESSRSSGNGKTTLQFASLSFDVSFQEIFSTWSIGGTLVLISEELRRDLRKLWQLLVTARIERLFVPPVVLRHLALAAEKEESVPGSLREIIAAGEQLQVTAPIKRMFARLPGCTLHNQYGPSETHVVTSCRLTGNPHNWAELTPIGRPIQNVEVYLLDEHLQPVDGGLVGELFIGGVCLSDGYLGGSALNDERFIPNPFVSPSRSDSNSFKGRLYRTGDMARKLPDGNFEFLGRTDHQLKIRGHRIEVGEVEAALLSHPKIREALVTAKQDKRGERQLVGYIVADDPMPSIQELRRHLGQILPTFMIPSSLLYLDNFPLTPNGKINRTALPNISNKRPTLGHIVAPAANDIEGILATIWERVLNISPIGTMDDFFELGGDSLMTVALLIEINETFGRNLPACTLLTQGTIKKLARVLASDQEEPESSLVAIKPSGKLPPLILLPPIGGEILGYRALAPHLNPEQPLYGIRPQGLDGRTEPCRDLKQMAAFHLEELLDFRPNGPFLLGGYSSGGTIAFEMAQQLYARGFRDIKVFIIDEEAPLPSQLNVRALKNVAQNTPKWFVDHILDRPRHELKVSINGNLAKVWRLSKRVFQTEQSQNEPDYEREVSEFINTAGLSKECVKVCTAMWEALLSYAPSVYPGEIMLLRTRAQRIMSTFGFDKGWGQLAAGGVKIKVVAGNHNTVGEGENAKGLAEAISGLLDQT